MRMGRIVGHMGTRGDEMKLQLQDVYDALSDTIDLADSWASCGPETYTRDERKRRDKAVKILNRLGKRPLLIDVP